MRRKWLCEVVTFLYYSIKPVLSQLLYHLQIRALFCKVVDAQPKSRIWYRIGATRNITGGRRIQPGMKMSDKLKDVSTTRCPFMAAAYGKDLKNKKNVYA